MVWKQSQGSPNRLNRVEILFLNLRDVWTERRSRTKADEYFDKHPEYENDGFYIGLTDLNSDPRQVSTDTCRFPSIF